MRAMKLTDLWRSRKTPTVSFEFFPPRTPKAAAAQEKAIDEVAALRPDFVSVTFGAGGSSREGSRELVAKLRARGLETLGYVAAYGLAPEVLLEVVESYRALGVENVLAVRGDVPQDQPGFVRHPESFEHASQFLEFLSRRRALRR